MLHSCLTASSSNPKNVDWIEERIYSLATGCCPLFYSVPWNIASADFHFISSSPMKGSTVILAMMQSTLFPFIMIHERNGIMICGRNAECYSKNSASPQNLVYSYLKLATVNPCNCVFWSVLASRKTRAENPTYICLLFRAPWHYFCMKFSMELSYSLDLVFLNLFLGSCFSFAVIYFS